MEDDLILDDKNLEKVLRLILSKDQINNIVLPFKAFFSDGGVQDDNLKYWPHNLFEK